MQLIRGFNKKSSNNPGVVATIGNFDGVHLGHQTIFKKLLQKSSSLGLSSTVIAFEPTAKEFFSKNNAPPRLTRFREKFSLINDLGIDQFVCLPFNAALANMPAESFVENVLVDYLNIKHLTVGDNFRFGKNRTGDYELLKNLSDKFNYAVENTDSYCVNGDRVSSSSIRNCLANGDLATAEQFLGRTYSMSGHVIHGDKKGRTIGFPTANIPIKRIKSPVSGVFAVKVIIEDDLEQYGVANVGRRPTVDGTKTQLEVHIFNFSKDIYRKHLTVYFYKKIRDEIKFESFEALKSQIHQDSDTAKKYFDVAA